MQTSETSHSSTRSQSSPTLASPLAPPQSLIFKASSPISLLLSPEARKRSINLAHAAKGASFLQCLAMKKLGVGPEKQQEESKETTPVVVPPKLGKLDRMPSKKKKELKRMLLKQLSEEE